jgi:hypothetical protein
MKRVWIVIVAFVALPAALAQAPAQPASPPPAAEKPVQDAAAVKLIERCDALRHVPRAEGLVDLQFIVRLPMPLGLDLAVSWKAPDKVAGAFVVPDDAPPDRLKQLTITAAEKGSHAKGMAGPFVQMMIGEVLRDTYKDDEITLAAANQVKIVPKSATSKSTFKEQVLTFDDRGLLKQVKITSPTGSESVMNPAFVEWNKKFVYQSMTTTIGKTETSVSFEYGNAGDFLLVKKATMSVKMPGKPEPQTQILEFRSPKVNTGLDDKLFEEKK